MANFIYTTNRIDWDKIFTSQQLISGLQDKNGNVFEARLCDLGRLRSPSQVIVHLILKKMVMFDQRERIHGYTSLSVKYLNLFMSDRKRRQSLVVLESLGIIKVNEKFNYLGDIGKRFSKSYKITDEFMGEIVIHKGSTNTKFINRSKWNIEDKGTIREEEGRKKQIAVPLLNLPEFALFEYSNLQRIVTEPTEDQFYYHADLALEMLDRYSTRFRAPARIERDIRLLQNKHFRMSFSSVNNRISTNLTYMKKEFRQFFFDEVNRPFIELDFKSCHLYLLLKVISDAFGEDGNMNNLRSRKLFREELERFKALVLSGSFYNHFLRKNNLDPVDENYERVKRIIFSQWFNRTRSNSRVYRSVVAEFPLISEFLLNEMEGSGIKITNRLTRIESELINTRIMVRISKEIPSCKVFTLNDGFLAEPRYFGAIVDIMREESIQLLGFELRGSIKDRTQFENLDKCYKGRKVN